MPNFLVSIDPYLGQEETAPPYFTLTSNVDQKASIPMSWTALDPQALFQDDILQSGLDEYQYSDINESDACREVFVDVRPKEEIEDDGNELASFSNFSTRQNTDMLGLRDFLGSDSNNKVAHPAPHWTQTLPLSSPGVRIGDTAPNHHSDGRHYCLGPTHHAVAWEHVPRSDGSAPSPTLLRAASCLRVGNYGPDSPEPCSGVAILHGRGAAAAAAHAHAQGAGRPADRATGRSGSGGGRPPPSLETVLALEARLPLPAAAAALGVSPAALRRACRRLGVPRWRHRAHAAAAAAAAAPAARAVAYAANLRRRYGGGP